MKREEIADLMAFVVVAEERSFTRAAARLSMAQSALSQIVRRIEERLGLRLLTRTTRSVVPTEAGEHLLSVLGPMLHDIDSAMASLSDLQNRRAMIEGMSSDKGFERLVARVPLAEMYRYSTTLSSLTNGRATYSMKFASYEQVPADVQEKLLKAYADTDKDKYPPSLRQFRGSLARDFPGLLPGGFWFSRRLYVPCIGKRINA